MATNSRREQILSTLETNLSNIDSVKQVQRTIPSTLEDIKRYSSHQMPLVAMVGSVPQPVEHVSGRAAGGVDVILSDLKVQLFVYFMDNVTPDSTLSSLLDDLWAALYASQTLGFKWVTGMRMAPDMRVAVFAPYVAFSITLTYNYKHTTGGI